MASANTYLQSPTQAYDLFSQPRQLPRQRHVFLLRFKTTIQGVKLDDLTFAIKTVERPKISIKTEEMNQYNKKRQVYTGFKYEPIRMQFYDTANGAAQEMWKAYARYYFGDFTPGIDSAYHYDVTHSLLANSDKLGFIAPAAGPAAGAANQSTDNDAQFYLHSISIYQLFDGKYEEYTLINPRLTMWEPDDLDYENGSVSLISTSVVFENVQYATGALDNGNFAEFSQGGGFYGSPVAIAANNLPSTNAIPSLAQSGPTITPVSISNTAPSSQTATNYRYSSPPSGGSLGMYGNFQFGATAPVSAAASNTVGSLLGGVQNAVNPATYDVTAATAGSISSGFGSVAQTLTRGLLAASAINGAGMVRNAGGAQLPPSAYGAINAYQTGTAQYGYNPNTATDGSSWGYNGPDGYSGPVGQQNNGPYSAYQPAGLDGRFDTDNLLGGLY